VAVGVVTVRQAENQLKKQRDEKRILVVQLVVRYGSIGSRLQGFTNISGSDIRGNQWSLV